MSHLTARDCLWKYVLYVQEEDRPQNVKAGMVYAVFTESSGKGILCGVATEGDIAKHPEWIFADLVEHRPLHTVSALDSLHKVMQYLRKTQLEALPVMDRGKFIGVVTHISLLQGLLGQERKLLREAKHYRLLAEEEGRQLKVWSRRLSELHEASRKLLSLLAHSTLENDLLQAGIEALCSLLEARYGAIGILDQGGELAQFVYTGISEEQARKIGHLPEGRGLLGVVINENTTLRLEDMSKHPSSAGFPKHHPPMRSLLAVPISHAGRVYGRIYMSDKLGIEPFSEDDELLALSFAHSLSLVLDNARELEEIRQAQKKLNFLAHFDVLTHLPNRELAVDRIKQAIVHARRHPETIMAILFVDIDHFKYVNDTFGHNVGDQLLQNISERLRQCLREIDTVARIGGDEFMILLTDISDPQDAATVAHKIIQTLSTPYTLEGHEIFAGCSIGISVFPEDADNIEDLMRHADTAMYHAKNNGRNHFKFFTANLNVMACRHAELEQALRRAIQGNEFELHYQPKIDLQTGAISGVEALVRWNSPSLGKVPPSEFIPIAEDVGLIIPIGEWILKTACQQCKIWGQMGFEDIHVAVNISARQFVHKGFTSQLIEIVQGNRLPEQMLELEVTENMMMQDMDHVIQVLHEIHDAGINISIDDFGTGYSSLNYLKRFPISTLKIDQGFVSDIMSDSNDAEIVKAIIAMAHNLGLKVVAEGVETQEQLTFLEESACDYIQGYLVSKPVPSEELTDMLKHGYKFP